MKRLPLWGRMLGSLLIGHEADIVRGDLEEAYLRRTRNRASSYLADLLKTLFIWWSPASIWRRKRKTPSTGGTMGFGTFEDLRHVCRNLIRRPGFALTVLVTLGLGIGATTTIYSVVDAVVVRPLPYPNADRLVVMGNTTPGKEWRDDASGLHRLIRMSGPNAMDWKLRSRSFEKFALVEAGPIVMMNSGVAEVVQHAAVGSGFFELFPVKPFVGRVFSEDDYAGRNGPVQMLSYGAWVRKHGADPKVIGTKIIGVLPPEYTQPESLGRDEIEFWSALDPNSRRYSPRDRATLILFGRLSRGVTLDSARKELTSIQDAVSSEFPAGNVLQDGSHRGAGINYLHADIVGASSKTLWIFLAASSFLLLIAVLNAANLLLVRGLDREHDVSVRQALGASPTRLVRSQLTESLVLALVSGGLGVLLAYAGVEAFLRIGPASLPRLGAIAVNWRILAATITVSLGVGVVVGLIPALRLTKRDVALALRRTAGRTFSSPAARIRQMMVVSQLALAVLLCVGACLLINSYVRLRTVDPGFEPSRLTTVSVSMKRPGARFDAIWLDWDELRRSIESIAGLDSVAITSNVPFQARVWEPSIMLPEDSNDVFRGGTSGFVVTPDYFDAMEMNLKAGRKFGPQDGPASTPVTIVNEAFAREYLQNHDPIGTTIRVRTGEGGVMPLEVVGVLGNVVHARAEDGWQPAIYLPHTQAPAGPTGGMANVVVRSNRAPEDLAKDLRRAVGQFTPIPPLELSLMENRIGLQQTGPRFNALLIGTFATVAILLAAVGLYGTMAHSVGCRQRELGIRMAIGADTHSIFRMVMREGLAVSGVGLAIGLGATFGLTRFLRSFLFQVDALDPVTLIAASAILTGVVLLAVLRPARQATRVDPLGSLRSE